MCEIGVGVRVLGEPVRPGNRPAPARGRRPAVPVAVFVDAAPGVSVGMGVVELAHCPRPPAACDAPAAADRTACSQARQRKRMPRERVRHMWPHRPQTRQRGRLGSSIVTPKLSTGGAMEVVLAVVVVAVPRALVSTSAWDTERHIPPDANRVTNRVSDRGGSK